jgi:hypothetical protein
MHTRFISTAGKSSLIVSASKEPQVTAEPKTNSHQYSLSERQSVLRRDMSAMKRAPQYGLGACCWERLAI